MAAAGRQVKTGNNTAPTCVSQLSASAAGRQVKTGNNTAPTPHRVGRSGRAGRPVSIPVSIPQSIQLCPGQVVVSPQPRRRRPVTSAPAPPSRHLSPGAAVLSPQSRRRRPVMLSRFHSSVLSSDGGGSRTAGGRLASRASQPPELSLMSAAAQAKTPRDRSTAIQAGLSRRRRRITNQQKPTADHRAITPGSYLYFYINQAAGATRLLRSGRRPGPKSPTTALTSSAKKGSLQSGTSSRIVVVLIE